MIRGKKKNWENYVKNGGKGLKNESFWVINSKKLRENSTDPDP